MSFNRIRSFFSFQPSTSNNIKKAVTPHLDHTLFDRVCLAPFAMLSFLQGANAADLYAQEPGTNTTFLAQYAPADFPHLKNALIDYCHTILSSASNLTFQHASSPQCVSEDGVTGPTIDLSVEMGKNLTLSFQQCLNQTMQEMCKAHYDANEIDTDKYQFIMLCILAGTVGVGVCVGIGCVVKNSMANKGIDIPLVTIADRTGPHYQSMEPYPSPEEGRSSVRIGNRL